MFVILFGLLLAGTFFGLHTILRRRDDGLYKRVTIVGIVTVIGVAWALFAAAQLGLIGGHAR